MTPSKRMPTRRPITLGASAALLIVTLTGCAGTTASESLPEAATTASASTSTTPPTASAVTDVESCTAFSDVSTILFNATVGLNQGRMTQQEYDGWMRLATRVLDRVPVRGEGAVSDAINTLKSVAPPVPAGSSAPTVINTDEWNNAAPLSDACDATGEVFATEGFTGG